MQTNIPTPEANTVLGSDIHQSIGLLTRQLHDALNSLGGLSGKVRELADELPDAKSRLSYIARLTGEAAEKVLNRVDQAKIQQHHIAEETKRIGALMAKEPVNIETQSHVLSFLADLEQSTKQTDEHLTEIMMAQDFHDLTGQVIAKVVNLAANIEEQLVQLLIQTAPADAAVKAATTATPPAVDHHPTLAGPVVNAEGNPDVVTGQSEVDDLLASLGF